MTRTRSAARTEFLTDLLTTALYHQGYGQFDVTTDRTDANSPYAVIQFHEDGPEGGRHTVNLDTMARGLRVIRDAVLGPAGPLSLDPDGQVYCNRTTGERLYFGGLARTDLLTADRTNGKDGDYDVIGALAVLECAIFGRVVYA